MENYRQLMTARTATRVIESGNDLGQIARDVSNALDGIFPPCLGHALRMHRQWIALEPAARSIDAVVMMPDDSIELIRIGPNSHRRIAKLLDKSRRIWRR